MQVKGKAAIDVACNPLGKSGGALIQQFLILGFGSLAASTPYLGAILLVIVLAWLENLGSCVQVTYHFVNVLNEQGFIEGRYVPIVDGQAVAAITPAPIASTTNGDGSTEKQGKGERDIPASEAAPIN
ncbi:unnamed protein product [Sphagnum balticum]